MERILQTHRADIASGHQRRKVPNQDLFQVDTQLANQYRNLDTLYMYLVLGNLEFDLNSYSLSFGWLSRCAIWVGEYLCSIIVLITWCRFFICCSNICIYSLLYICRTSRVSSLIHEWRCGWYWSSNLLQNSQVQSSSCRLPHLWPFSGNWKHFLEEAFFLIGGICYPSRELESDSVPFGNKDFPSTEVLCLSMYPCILPKLQWHYLVTYWRAQEVFTPEIPLLTHAPPNKTQTTCSTLPLSPKKKQQKHNKTWCWISAFHLFQAFCCMSVSRRSSRTFESCRRRWQNRMLGPSKLQPWNGAYKLGTSALTICRMYV